jgi:hypothetical protein
MYQNSFASDQGLWFLFAFMKKSTDAKLKFTQSYVIKLLV